MLSLLLLLATGVPALADGTSALVTVPKSQPPYAKPISPDLGGLSLEFSDWPSYAGSAVGQPNKFVNQLLSNIKSRTGVSPPIRIGGTSEDFAVLDPSQQIGGAIYPNGTAVTPYPGATNVSIGKDFYALSGNMPSDTKFMWGVAFRSQPVNQTIAQVQELARVFQGDRKNVLSGQSLEFLQLGNEPNFWNLYPGWSYANWTQLWNNRAATVSKYIQLSTGGTTLLPGSFAASTTTIPWSAQYAFDAGLLDDSRTRGYISAFDGHKYSGARRSTQAFPVGSLQDKNNIFGNFSIYLPDIVAANAKGVKYIYGETNSFAGHGIPGLSNTAEAAIWGVTYMLEGASLGIERMYFHNGVGYFYDTIEPSGSVTDFMNYTRPHAGPLYNAFLVVGEAIGSNGGTRVSQFGSTNNSISAYGIWENKKLVRAVVINHDPYVDSTVARPSFDVSFEGLNIGVATVKSLYTPLTNSQRNITWAGQNFDTPDGVPVGFVVEPYLNGSTLTIQASTVSLICFK